MEIKLLQKADFSAVRDLYKAVRIEYLESQRQVSGKVYDPVGLELDAPQFDFYAATRCSFVAIDNGKLVGFLLSQQLRWINERSNVLWIEYIAVQASYRRSGVGLSLVSAAKHFTKEHDIAGLFATLNIDNQESNSLLFKAGFDVKDWRIASYPPDVPTKAAP